MIAGQPRSRFNPHPTSEYLATVDALRRLGPEVARDAFADAIHDEGEFFAASSGWRVGKLSEHNVGRLLAGIPETLLLMTEPRNTNHLNMNVEWQRKLFEQCRREEAARRRKDIIERIANRNGWMDHGGLFNHDGEPIAIVGHPYDLRAEHMAEILMISAMWGLEAHVSGSSWYYPGWTSRVLLYKSEPIASPSAAPEPAQSRRRFPAERRVFELIDIQPGIAPMTLRVRLSHSAPTMASPDARMMLLLVSASPDERTEPTVEIFPVLKLRSYVREESRFSPDDRVLLDSFTSTVVTEALVCINGGEVESVEEAVGHLECVAYRTIVCPWAPSEDGEHFRPMLEALREEAIQKAQEEKHAELPRREKVLAIAPGGAR